MSDLERKFQRQFKLRWLNWEGGGWAQDTTAGRGSVDGLPDLLLSGKITNGLIFPLELKVGEIVDGSLVISQVRSSQRRWASKFSEAGGRSALCVGIPDPSGLMFRMVHIKNMLWVEAGQRTKFAPEEFVLCLTTGSFVDQLIKEGLL